MAAELPTSSLICGSKNGRIGNCGAMISEDELHECYDDHGGLFNRFHLTEGVPRRIKKCLKFNESIHIAILSPSTKVTKAFFQILLGVSCTHLARLSAVMNITLRLRRERRGARSRGAGERERGSRKKRRTKEEYTDKY